ncbi:hypothetical protein, partial [Longimycelium tulufanense]|uniref:hypothetical protein n=1 Tax=Longimycelium tulufanense TaxID=907463 RepID=UPI001665D6B9
GRGGPARGGWAETAARAGEVAEAMAALAEHLPAGEPSPEQARRLRRALGVISQHSGVLKKALGVGFGKS